MTMFDHLHDPEPPPATSRHLAVAAERAAGMRRRRTALVGGAAAVALVAAGTVAVAATGRTGTGDTELADPLPPEVVDETDDDTGSSTPSAAPVTTSLDPESLPPAVPVNPDPEDLPPAVPVDEDPASDAGPSGDEAGPATGSDVDASPDDASSGDTEPASPTPDGGLDAAQVAARRADDPVTAITTDGGAVWFPTAGDDPLVVVSGGNAARVDFLADGTATVEYSGSPNLTTVAPDGSTGDAFTLGTSHAVGPDGSTVCALGSGGSNLRCTAGGGDVVVRDFDASDVVAVDLMWLDADTVLVLGRSDSWSLTTVDLGGGSTATEPFASLSAYTTLRFAGRDTGGAVVVHDAGTSVALVGSLDRFAAWDPDGAAGLDTALETRRWDEPMRSIWLDAGDELLVAVDGTLTVNGDEVNGTYVSART